jgi:hypothetical protein
VTDTIAGTPMAITGGLGTGTTAGGTLVGSGTGPAVNIENASFHTDADLDLLLRTAEFAVLVGRV